MSETASAELTLLNRMLGDDFEAGLDRHVELGIEQLDLAAVGRPWLAEVGESDARRAAEAIEARDLSVHAFSTSVFYGPLDRGEDFYRGEQLAELDHVLGLAHVLRPRYVRVIASALPGRTPETDAIATLRAEYPWVFDVYRDAVDRIADAGFAPLVENECGECLLSSVDDFRGFFAELDRPRTLRLTWDVQNHWSTGVFPSNAVYEALRDLIAYYHVKGGTVEDGSARLGDNVALEESDWPVVQITRRVVRDGVSPVICVNPSQHGAYRDDYDYDAVPERDIRFLRESVAGIA